MADIYTELGVTRRHIDYLLTGKSNASPGLARRIEKRTGIKRELWVFGTPAERRAAWEKFRAQERRRGGSRTAPTGNPHNEEAHS